MFLRQSNHVFTRKALASCGLMFALIASLFVFATPARSDVPAIQNVYNVSGVSTTAPMSLQGCSSLAVVVSGTYTGLTAVPQASNDFPATNPGTYATVTGISGGAITANGNYGPVTISTTGVGSFQLNVTAISTGTARFVVTCTASAPAGSGGGGGAAPTVSPGGFAGAVVVCPSTEPGTAPINGVYTCTIDSTGKLQVAVSNTSPIPVATASSYPIPTASAGVALPTSAPAVIAYNACYRILGGVPVVSVGNGIAMRCSSSGQMETLSVLCALGNIDTNGTCATPGPAPTASAGAATSGTVLPVVAYDACTYNTGAIAVTNTNAISTQCDVSGNLKTVVAPVPNTFATAVATLGPLIVNAGAATVYSGFYTNSNAATIYCSLFNVAAGSVTPGTTQPLLNIAVPAGQTMPFFTPPTQGLTFSTAISSFCATAFQGATSAGASTMWLSLFYR